MGTGIKSVFVVLLVGLAGCESRYRYPCQDPANWGTEACLPPICSADGSCTEMTLRQPKCADPES